MNEEEIINSIEKIEETIKKTLTLYSKTRDPEVRKEIVKTIRKYFKTLANAEEPILIIYAYLLFSPTEKKEIRYVV